MPDNNAALTNHPQKPSERGSRRRAFEKPHSEKICLNDYQVEVTWSFPDPTSGLAEAPSIDAGAKRGREVAPWKFCWTRRRQPGGEQFPEQRAGVSWVSDLSLSLFLPVCTAGTRRLPVGFLVYKENMIRVIECSERVRLASAFVKGTSPPWFVGL